MSQVIHPVLMRKADGEREREREREGEKVLKVFQS
jgi:hypothetical protein